LARRDVNEEAGSERTCIVSGLKGPPETMLRFALSGEGQVAPDIRRKLPGRGVWTRLNRETVRQAAAKKAFARAFRAPAEAPPGLADLVDALLERDALQFLSLANKAGLAVAGAFKVDEAIVKGRVAALIQASDGAADGAAKRERALRARLAGETDAVERVNLFSSRQLDLALGKANVIHAALNAGAATSAFLERAERLRRYRADDTATADVAVVSSALARDAGEETDLNEIEPERGDRGLATGNIHE
jgi:predicted RNA-binding protein YlxR (DUF448 family)